MKLGDIVYLKKANNLMGEIKAIDEMDRATLSLCKEGIEIIVPLYELGETGAVQANRALKSVVHILGIPYKILIIEEGDYRYDKDADGWCDTSVKELLVFNYKQDIDSKRDLVEYQNKVIRHEIIHAFLYESGLDNNSLSGGAWAKNEEMVDWLSIQFPKIFEAFREAGVFKEAGNDVASSSN